MRLRLSRRLFRGTGISDCGSSDAVIGFMGIAWYTADVAKVRGPGGRRLYPGVINTQLAGPIRGDILNPMRFLPALLASAALFGALAATVRASEPAATVSIPRLGIPEFDAAGESGAYCTRLGCLGASPSPFGEAAGFGAAVLAAGWLGRRHHGLHR